MIKIAVIDDERKERDILIRYYRAIQDELKEELNVYAFASGDEFLKEFDCSYDLICLDIDMDGKDGISTAKLIREQDDKVIIIFITNMAQMAIRGYEVQALDFVLKPVNYYSFAMKMRSAFKIIGNKKSRNIIIPMPNGMKKISSDDLLYAEVNGHYLYYHTTEGVFRQKVTLKELEEKLTGLSFKRCNHCYLVNLKYVDTVKKDDLKIGDEWLKISRPRKKAFLQALANFMGGIEL
ncbi:MAG: LytR/AlgR family response regulator transcription factor [Lachnospiraceae bacterium]